MHATATAKIMQTLKCSLDAISTAEQPALGDAATGAAGGDAHAHGKEADELSFSYDGSEMDDLDEDDDDAESRKPQPAKVR